MKQDSRRNGNGQKASCKKGTYSDLSFVSKVGEPITLRILRGIGPLFQGDVPCKKILPKEGSMC